MLYKRANKSHICFFPNKTNYVDTMPMRLVALIQVANYALKASNLISRVFWMFLFLYILLHLLRANFIIPLFCVDLKKHNNERRQTGPYGIDNFSHISAIDWCRVAYRHPDIMAKVFLEYIKYLSPKVTLAEITVIVNHSKADSLGSSLNKIKCD